MTEGHVPHAVPDVLVGYHGKDDEVFQESLQEIKIYYSQPAMRQSADRIKQGADEVLSEKPLTIIRDGETITYDASGRPVNYATLHQQTSRVYDEKGFIQKEIYRSKNPNGEVLEEDCEFSYGYQAGNRAVMQIHVAPYRIDANGKKKASQKPFIIDLSDISPVRKLKMSYRRLT